MILLAGQCFGAQPTFETFNTNDFTVSNVPPSGGNKPDISIQTNKFPTLPSVTNIVNALTVGGTASNVINLAAGTRITIDTNSATLNTINASVINVAASDNILVTTNSTTLVTVRATTDTNMVRLIATNTIGAGPFILQASGTGTNNYLAGLTNQGALTVKGNNSGNDTPFKLGTLSSGLPGIGVQSDQSRYRNAASFGGVVETSEGTEIMYLGPVAEGSQWPRSVWHNIPTGNLIPQGAPSLSGGKYRYSEAPADVYANAYGGSGASLADLPARGDEIWDAQRKPFVVLSTRGSGVGDFTTTCAFSNVVAGVDKFRTNGYQQVLTNMGVKMAFIMENGWLTNHRSSANGLLAWNTNNFPGVQGLHGTQPTNVTTYLRTNGFETWLLMYAHSRVPSKTNWPNSTYSELQVTLNGAVHWEYPGGNGGVDPNAATYRQPCVTFDSMHKDISTFYSWGVRGIFFQDVTALSGSGYFDSLMRSMASAALNPYYNPGQSSEIALDAQWNRWYPGDHGMILGFFAGSAGAGWAAKYAGGVNSMYTESNDSIAEPAGSGGLGWLHGQLRFQSHYLTNAYGFSHMTPGTDGAGFDTYDYTDWKSHFSGCAMFHANVWLTGDNTPYNYFASNTFGLLLTNRFFVDAWQDVNGTPPICHALNNSNSVWSRTLKTGEKLVWMANLNAGTTTNLTITCAQLGYPSNTWIQATELWTNAVISTFTNALVVTVPVKGSQLIKFAQLPLFAGDFTVYGALTNENLAGSGYRLVQADANGKVSAVMTTNSVGGGGGGGGDTFWGTNASGFLTNRTADLGSEIYLFGGAFRMHEFTFHGTGFNIDSDGTGSSFGTIVPNGSNYFQAGTLHEIPIIEITTNHTMYFGSNVIAKRDFTVTDNITNTASAGSGYRLVQADANGKFTAILSTNSAGGGGGSDVFWTNSNTLYVSADSTSNGVKGVLEFPYSISNAFKAAVPGDSIVIWPGTYNVTNSLTNVINGKVFNYGEINWWNSSTTSGAPVVCFPVADNLQFYNFGNIRSRNPQHGALIGGRDRDGIASGTNVFIFGGLWEGVEAADVFMFYSTNVAFDVTIESTTAKSHWDLFVAAGGTNSAAETFYTHSFRLKNNNWEIDNTGFTFGSPTPVAQPARAVFVLNGRVEVYDSVLKAHDGASGENHAVVTSTDAGNTNLNTWVKVYNSALFAVNAVAVDTHPIELFSCETNNINYSSSNSFHAGTVFTIQGVLTNGNLVGTGYRLLQSDANGKVTAMMATNSVGGVGSSFWDTDPGSGIVNNNLDGIVRVTGESYYSNDVHIINPGSGEEVALIEQDGTIFSDVDIQWAGSLGVLDSFGGAQFGAPVDVSVSLAIGGTDIILAAGGNGTFVGDVSVQDDPYDESSWDGNVEVPTKNAVRDKIESLGAGGFTTPFNANQFSTANGTTNIINAALVTNMVNSGTVALSDGATIATDSTLGTTFRVTLGGNRTLSNPTSPRDGQRYTWEIIQDATGVRTLAMDTKFAFGTDITGITLTTNATKRDFITAVYNSTADKFYVVGFVRGY